METETTRETIRAITKKFITAPEIADDIPLTTKPYYADARSIAAIFIDIEHVFKVDLNKIFSQALDYSINSITEAVRACKEN